MSSFCLTLILTLYQRFVLQGRSADIVEWSWGEDLLTKLFYNIVLSVLE
jgi:hypothetical protein